MFLNWLCIETPHSFPPCPVIQQGRHLQGSIVAAGPTLPLGALLPAGGWRRESCSSSSSRCPSHGRSLIRLEKFNSLPDDNPPPHPIIPLEAEHFPVIDIDRTLTFLTWPNHHKVFFLLSCPRKPSGDCPQVA